ncbi:MAG: bifunctional phosphopantothenoylcysteine decarboxylase/phosphopantothenate--cysteine ligase CoaBC [Bacteroidales bacterium]|nr:bifunctional phosphopantothenoylcysteine decarboxylase/phosphopantothenate--cysteine ligase CoaBC [Bacteroidales bacterium]
MNLKNKHIILGITGSIAAYKAAYLTRLFIKEGAEVKIIVTPFAKEFITPVTLATLSKNTVLCDFFYHDDGAWNSHIELGIWADLMLIAPATANTIAKMAHGIADNLLLTTYLSVRCPVMVAPAMDTDMYMHVATQQNIQTLSQRGVMFIEPPTGELASGLTGKGRMEEPENILQHVINFFQKSQDFSGKKVLITAGPTCEYLDPVRFISNSSSGKMGTAIAQEMARRGADVIFVCGPIANYPTHPNITIEKIISADEMLESCKTHIDDADIAIFSAAVADYKPKDKTSHKIKKQQQSIILELEPTPDIAETLGKYKKNNQLFIGFALETENEENSAKEKLHRKNLDIILLNTITPQHNPIANTHNSFTVFDKHNNIHHLSFKSKEQLAIEIADVIKKYIS